MQPRRRILRTYGQPSDHPPLEWDWVRDQLESAGTYWVVARSAGHPHPRPVWGVWQRDQLHLSIGGLVLARALAADPQVTVHLESGTDVVILEGGVMARPGTAQSVLDAYNQKYDWDYLVDQYGDLSGIAPSRILAWRTAGWAGRESFRETGSWAFDPLP